MFLGCSFFELTVSESTPNFSPHFNLSHLVKYIQLCRKKNIYWLYKAAKVSDKDWTSICYVFYYFRQLKAVLCYRASQNCSFYVHTPPADKWESVYIKILYLLITKLSLLCYFICCLRQFQFASCPMNGYCRNSPCFLQKVAVWIKQRNSRNYAHCGQAKAWSTSIPVLLPL